MPEPLLVELLTEELPPKSLRAMADAFAARLAAELQNDRFLPEPVAAWPFATPRRLAVLIGSVNERSPDSERDVQGPPVGAPIQAVSGFAKKNGVSVESLSKAKGPKGEVYVARVRTAGAALGDILAGKVEAALRALPIPKIMRWGAGEAQFVRPVHGLVMLHGKNVVPGTVLGLHSGKRTRGHRFMGDSEIVLARADRYDEQMAAQSVIVAFDSRKAFIDALLQKSAAEQKGSLGEYRDLLDEVTALVEFPAVYVGAFDPGFLGVPQECLILTMRQNQKYFPLFDAAGKLLPRFLIVSNMRIPDPRHIVSGNERVVRPRLEDARFFYDQDRKTRLEERVPQLAKVVYHGKLGTQLERVQRIQLLAGSIARELEADAAAAERAAWLSKADLLTGMVGEFPELQGVMGRYYALHDGEPRNVADAIAQHYRPRYAGDQLPEGQVACAVAIADKLDALAGLFAIGQVPTGDKDPFGLRRAALGLVRILVEQNVALVLSDLLKRAFAPYAGKSSPSAQADLQTFVFERARGYFQELGYSALEIEAVLSLSPARLDLVPRQLEAVRAFSGLPEAQSLAAANKRIGNILKQADGASRNFDATLFALPEEKALEAAFKLLRPEVDRAFEALDYTAALKALAALRGPVDAFFDKVMVMDKDARIRANRIGFLGMLHGTMNRVADLSKLAK